MALLNLYYWNDEPNFGDQLNPWLWPKVLGDIFKPDSDQVLVGIGTLLNKRIPKAEVTHVFGSGIGYGELPVLDDSWAIHGVRGKLSAKALGLPERLAISDPAYLLTQFPRPDCKKTMEIGYMPHHQSLIHADWRTICEEAGLLFIDPRGTVDDTLKLIASCDRLITEAMHGAIVADALRTPWLGVSCYPHINMLKWRDWLTTTDAQPRPHYLPPLYEFAPPATPRMTLKYRILNRAKALGYEGRLLSGLLPNKTSSTEMKTAITGLRKLKSSRHYTLSSEYALDGLVYKQLEALHRLRMRMRPVSERY